MYPRFILLVSCAPWLLASPGHSETRRVKIRFEIDGKSVVGPREIEFYTTSGRRIARADIVEGTFGVPVTVPMDPVEVRLRLAGRTLVFTDIYPSKFECSWTVGIDTPPFDEENVQSIPLDRDLKEHWFVSFSPADGDGTRLVVSIPGGPDTSGKMVSLVGRLVAYRPLDRIRQLTSFVENEELFLLKLGKAESKHGSLAKIRYRHFGVSEITKDLFDQGRLLNLRVRRDRRCDERLPDFVSKAPRLKDASSGESLTDGVVFASGLADLGREAEIELPCYDLESGSIGTVGNF